MLENLIVLLRLLLVLYLIPIDSLRSYEPVRADE